MNRLLCSILIWIATISCALGETLTIATVTRPPFSMLQNEAHTGFSVELWQEIASELGLEFEFLRLDSFGKMLEMVQDGRADGAIANISITADRETVMDFTQPIYASGLQIMVPGKGSASVWRDPVLIREFGIAFGVAIGFLFLTGMLMWMFERRRQPYFERPVGESAFPNFWWALNLVVNGGFEERVPRSFPGRVLGVLMVFISLFAVSVFVARITSVMTVEALQSTISSVSDLHGRRVGTTSGSTASAFLEMNGVIHEGFGDLEALYQAFEGDELDAVLFDVPILAYYTQTRGRGKSELTGAVFKRENYGMALPQGSALREPFNRVLLRMREDGRYDELNRKWFGE